MATTHFLGLKKIIIQIFWEIVSGAFMAAAICGFAVPAEFPMTGFSGISILLYQFFGTPIGLSTVLLNIPVAIICFKLLGHKFLISSFRCMIIGAILIDYVAPLFPVYDGNRLLAAICTGVLGGISYGIIYMRNSSTGGIDFIIMAVKAVRPHLSLGKIVLVVDGAIVLLGGILLRDVDGVIYGLVVATITTIMIDKLMYGANAGKMALIITDKANEVCQAIDNTCQRGATVINAYGAYKGDSHKVVMCACSNKEMHNIQKAIKELDPASFMIILESHEVHGQGFKMLQVGEKQS